jgi:hypothetical protein
MMTYNVKGKEVVTCSHNKNNKEVAVVLVP